MGGKFKEGLACEAIFRRLESRDQRVRANVRFPEKEQHAFSVEATFEIGDQLYAMEHTAIEPFEGHMKMGARQNDILFRSRMRRRPISIRRRFSSFICLLMRFEDAGRRKCGQTSLTGGFYNSALTRSKLN